MAPGPRKSYHSPHECETARNQWHLSLNVGKHSPYEAQANPSKVFKTLQRFFNVFVLRAANK